MTKDLPTWDLKDLYLDPDAIEQTILQMQAEVSCFQKQHQNKLSTYDGHTLAQTLKDYEHLSERLARLQSYAELLFAQDCNHIENKRLSQWIQDQVVSLSTHLIFFTLEINALDDTTLEQAYQISPALTKYASWIRNLRLFKPYQLDSTLEKLLHETQHCHRMAWHRLFDETISSLRVEVYQEQVSLDTALTLLYDPDAVLRQKTAQNIGHILQQHRHIFSLITNTLIKEKSIEDAWRGYPTPMTSRHIQNCIEEDIVDSLVHTVKASYEKLSHRYYRLKAKWLKQEKLHYWDLYAPLPETQESQFSWQQACDIVYAAYERFSHEMAQCTRSFIEQNWIDAQPRSGKALGAFSHSTVPSVHPYILLNFHGKPHDVMILAHELGHGIHQILASSQGFLVSQTPLTLAETASVFGEMLTFDYLLNCESHTDKKYTLLANKVEDKLKTVVRQIAFFDFEKRLHTTRRQKGELTAEHIASLWCEVQAESLGPYVAYDQTYEYYWGYIPHFIHTPFYVYAYAFGDCLVNSLYASYQQQGDPERFQALYFDMLKSGGMKKHQELLTPFGFDLTDPDFWHQGLETISNWIDILEKKSPIP